MNMQGTAYFQSGETILYDTIMMGTYHDAFFQTHRIYTTESEPSYGMWTWGDNDVSV